MEAIALANAPQGFDANWIWSQFVGGSAQDAFTATIGRSIVKRRWFGSKTKTIRSLEILDAVPLSDRVRVVLIEIMFTDGTAEAYQLPLAVAIDAQRPGGSAATHCWADVRLDGQSSHGVLFEALDDVGVCAELLRLVERQSRVAGVEGGELVGWQTPQFANLHGDGQNLRPKLVQAEQSNSSVIYGERLILKVFRRVEMGLNPDLEIGGRLSERGFANTPPLAGGLEYRRAGHEPWSLAIVQGFVPNSGDAWHHTLARLDGFLRATVSNAPPKLPADDAAICQSAESTIPRAVADEFGEFISAAERLGVRTAEMHQALAAETRDPAFAPEPFTAADAQSFGKRGAALACESFALLRDHLPKLAGDAQAAATRLLAREAEAAGRFARLDAGTPRVAKIRCHGDYHLGQVFVSGNDYYIIDFEGEPARPLVERRSKQLAVRDVAGMIRSYHYASCAAANALLSATPARAAKQLQRWTRGWYYWTSVAFLAAYRRTAGAAEFLPTDGGEFQVLFDACLLEKALYELRYELNNRPDWVYLPLEALHDLLGPDSSKRS